MSLLTAPPPPAIYTLSLHDALPIFGPERDVNPKTPPARLRRLNGRRISLQVVSSGDINPIPERHDLLESADRIAGDRKSTRLNSSHVRISYAVFCLKKKITERKKYP